MDRPAIAVDPTLTEESGTSYANGGTVRVYAGAVPPLGSGATPPIATWQIRPAEWAQMQQQAEFDRRMHDDLRLEVRRLVEIRRRADIETLQHREMRRQLYGYQMTDEAREREIQRHFYGEMTEEARARINETVEAQRRARRLLLDTLTPKQSHQYQTRGYFIVKGGSSGSLYAIREGVAINVDQLDDLGVSVLSLCAYPNGVPVADVLLGQKLSLEANETMFLRIAHHHFPSQRRYDVS